MAHLSILAGTYPPPPIAIMRLGVKSPSIFDAFAWQSLWICSQVAREYINMCIDGGAAGSRLDVLLTSLYVT